MQKIVWFITCQALNPIQLWPDVLWYNYCWVLQGSMWSIISTKDFLKIHVLWCGIQCNYMNIWSRIRPQIPVVRYWDKCQYRTETDALHYTSLAASDRSTNLEMLFIYNLCIAVYVHNCIYTIIDRQIHLMGNVFHSAPEKQHKQKKYWFISK